MLLNPTFWVVVYERKILANEYYMVEEQFIMMFTRWR